MVIAPGSRPRRPWHRRVIAAVLIATIVGLPFNSVPATASTTDAMPPRAQPSPDQQAPAPSATNTRAPAPRPSAQVSPSQVSTRAKSAFEQIHNPFGDEWSIKVASPAGAQVGLTPFCFRDPANPDAVQDRWTALSNSPLIVSECVDVPDVSIPDALGNVGVPKLKQSIAAVKARNASIKYLAFLQLPRADTSIAGGSGKPVGLSFIDAVHEDWFVHIAGLPPTRANRVKYNNDTSDLYDVTNADFRQYMVSAIVDSLNYHGLDGFFLSDCLDLPFNAASTPVPGPVAQNWEAGCDALFASLKAAFDPLGKLVFAVGFDHVGTRGQGGVNEAAAFALFQKRMGISHGFFWEDPFRGSNVPDRFGELSFERYKMLRDYAVARGRYIVHTVNTFEGGQSTFPTTNAAQQRALARYYLAQFLAASAGPLTVMLYYYPTSVGPQFVSAASFREWDLAVGDALGPETKPASAVYQREFKNARVVANLSSNPFTVSLADGSYTDEDGVPVVGTSAVVPARTGAVFMRISSQAATCTPRPPVTVKTALNGPGQVKVTVTAGGIGAGNNALRSIRFNSTTGGGLLDAANQTGSPGDFTLSLPFNTEQTSFVIRRPANSGASSATVQFTVTDGCGDWPSFAGLGPNVP
jgi:hypothetical protein